MQERLGVAGSGAIACGLAATAARFGDVVLWARSDESARRARSTVQNVCGQLGDDADATNIRVETDIDALGEATAVIEAVAEDSDSKMAVLAELARIARQDALLGTTTSSLSIERLAAASGTADRFVGIHPFNPVPKMKLVELVFPPAATDSTRRRARQLCEDLGKQAIEVPDTPGFVVNRLLFPYLFDAVRLLERSGMDPEDIDRCMVMGAGHPMGPLALLDFVGLDIAEAIGDAIGVEVPAPVRALVAEGALGKKAGRGFFRYDE
jgi:3-hydroxybutyryl-CoA dehydrogenase